MAIGANSYGSVVEVAAITPMYTRNGRYGTGTRPTTTQVETFIDRVSGILNMVLAQAGFSVPVTQADAVLVMDEFVTEHAGYLAHAANRAGPYHAGSETLRGMTPLNAIRKAAAAFLEAHAAGLEALGCTRSRHLSYGLACRTSDDGGDEIVPPFQREMIENVITDWDA